MHMSAPLHTTRKRHTNGCGSTTDAAHRVAEQRATQRHPALGCGRLRSGGALHARQMRMPSARCKGSSRVCIAPREELMPGRVVAKGRAAKGACVCRWTVCMCGPASRTVARGEQRCTRRESLRQGAYGDVAHLEKSRGSAPAVEVASCLARLRVQSQPY